MGRNWAQQSRLSVLKFFLASVINLYFEMAAEKKQTESKPCGLTTMLLQKKKNPNKQTVAETGLVRQ